MATGEDILRIASTQVGYHEEAYHHNKYGAWYGIDGVAWCMEFVSWCYYKAHIRGPVLGLTDKQGGTASCGTLLRWYEAHQPDCITDKPTPGCVVIFDFPRTKYSTDHTGLFVKMEGGYITTIDGNTKNTSEPDDNGGWVQQRTRAISYANPTFIKPRELEEDMNIDELIRDITPEQVYQLASKMDDADLYKLYSKLESYMAKQPLPTSWDAATELREAMTLGITDGTRPMVPARRMEAAIMVKRAVQK